jgi:hypothetical protein
LQYTTAAFGGLASVYNMYTLYALKDYNDNWNFDDPSNVSELKYFSAVAMFAG